LKKQFLNQNIEEKRKLQFRTVKTPLKKTNPTIYTCRVIFYK